ncbi:MAG: hypothetical protein A2X25_06400 [Chloroflexi bacterium GWB2_49_20]|nr:MAG: hypothetical protein A2X25_06400 [Chloroflexi bacterium GWB2_49_20]OGN80328.1 MAG: hypothetical protein A2X26_08380 [Chloroflexi bacterium GWC2_49_37]OGN86032.1 MAG: hypothetical protein A2X27_00365 [Chloroflexi bacterium GWD2_49_16]HCC79331.1 hypothetical protein [Anaerolineae bacterium]HCM96448.1 hypothetical protein [Anaerolineae bacterium]
MMRFQTIGLIVNPFAGQGAAVNINLAQKGLTALGVSKVITGIGVIGADALIGLSFKHEIIPIQEDVSRDQTLELAVKLVNRSLDAVMVVGGDGTLADVAYIFSQFKNSPPLLGIGAGSTNAGELITCTSDQIDHLNPDMLNEIPVPALMAYVGDDLIGVGFNDCVLGLTVVATLDGKLRNVGVAKKFSGQTVPALPASIGLDQTQVERIGPQGRQMIAFGKSVSTVIIGLAESSFIAKAITGGVCLTAFSGLQAGCLVADQPLVQVELNSNDVLALPIIHSSYLSFSEQDRIHVRGVRGGTGLCVDGTPLRLLVTDQEVSFGVCTNAVRSIKIKKEQKRIL